MVTTKANGKAHPALTATMRAIGDDFAQAMGDIHASYFTGGDPKSSYYAGESTHYLPVPPGVNPLGSGADYHYRTEAQYMLMVERGRYFDRDNMVAGAGVNRLCSNIIQNGFALDVETGDKQINEDLAAYWSEWAGSPDECDFEGERSFHEMETLALRNQIVDGDVIWLPTKPGGIQFIENHRLRSPYGRHQNIIHGVELDSRRRRVRYWLTPEEIRPTQAINKRTEIRGIKARDGQGHRQVFHLYRPNRFSQTRGVTAFAPVVIPLSYHDDLQFANVVKAKVASFIAIFREMAEDSPKASDRVTGERSIETQGDNSKRVLERAGMGMTITGDPGEKLTGFSANIPNPEFFAHSTMLLTFVAINLDLPVQLLLLDPTKTNFSGWRGAMDQAKLRFRQIQRSCKSQLHIPAYRWKIRQLLQRDPILRAAAARSDVSIFRHTWHAPQWPYIEPMKDAMAADIRASRNQASQRRLAKEAGVDWDKESTDIIADRKDIISKALTAAGEINKEFPDADVNWREVAYGHQSAGVKYVFGSDLGESTDTEQGGDSGKQENA